MPNNKNSALIHLRMSPQLRDSVRDAADASGSSVNAFVVQILASAVGDPARFRAAVERTVEEAVELERDALGYPLRSRDRAIHISARTEYIGTMETTLGAREMVRLVKQHDAENPGHFVEWQRQRRAENGSADAAGAVAEFGDEAAALQRAQCPLLFGVDDQRLTGLTPKDEADDAIVAGSGAGHGAVVAIDGAYVHDRQHDRRV